MRIAFETLGLSFEWFLHIPHISGASLGHRRSPIMELVSENDLDLFTHVASRRTVGKPDTPQHYHTPPFRVPRSAYRVKLESTVVILRSCSSAFTPSRFVFSNNFIRSFHALRTPLRPRPGPLTPDAAPQIHGVDTRSTRPARSTDKVRP